ncbi:hypothetical protein LQZ19_11240, partial [Treponema primitia]|uniref:hypothetical protein n=1 Tax=Treponema primitia TaxID=88058 RepID=UPI00397E9D18
TEYDVKAFLHLPFPYVPIKAGVVRGASGFMYMEFSACGDPKGLRKQALHAHEAGRTPPHARFADKSREK